MILLLRDGASMLTGSASKSPAEVYAGRLAAHEAEVASCEAASARLSLVRGAVILLGVAVGLVAALTEAVSAAWLVIPVVLFIPLVVRHERIVRRQLAAQRAAAFFLAGLDRLTGRWPGHGPTGQTHAPERHPYAADLDLFGDGSLFQLLCTARTMAGEQTLARWLLAPASAAQVRDRQAAVRELMPRLHLRLDLALAGEDLRVGVHPGRLVAWGEALPRPRPSWWTPAAVGMSLATTLALVGWGLEWGPRALPGLVLLVHATFHWLQRRWVGSVVGGVEAPARELRVMAALLARIEREPVEAPLLRALREALVGKEGTASAVIARLERLVDRLDLHLNMLFVPVDLLLFWSYHHAAAIERWRSRWGASLATWLDATGAFEALASFASHGFEHPDDVLAELEEGGESAFEARGLAHPMLTEEQAVRNDLMLSGGSRVLVVSGSNMSGKSTLLRAAGLAAVMAQAGVPVRANRFRLSPLEVGASVRIVDSLLSGRSRFFAEITHLREIVDLLDGGQRLLFLLDEVLGGTNSHDRRIGAEALVRHLARHGAVGLVTTHDLALAQLGEALPGVVGNVHFQDEIVHGEMHFDYRLRPGTVEHSNALALMRSVGLPLDLPE
ncbi:MAG TPA: hypothetical protein PLS53_06150 [Thermoanaerobaculaceae bacterium]|nr:hypothetical protein [Thermoanaerobaculaceae bacterium]